MLSLFWVCVVFLCSPVCRFGGFGLEGVLRGSKYTGTRLCRGLRRQRASAGLRGFRVWCLGFVPELDLKKSFLDPKSM